MALISFFHLLGLLIVAQVVSSISREYFFNMSGASLPLADDGYSSAFSLTQPFQFYNNVQTKIYVSHNGVISFISGVSAFTADCVSVNRDNDFIAPFWADVDIRRHGSITYRESNNTVDINKANRQLKKAFPDYTTDPRMTSIFTATYKDVSFYNSTVSMVCPPGANIDALNTFQVTLATDGTKSYVIFYYEKIEWTAGTASGGDCTGKNGAYPKVGFNAHEKATFIPVGGSCSDQIWDLTTTSNVNEKGVWIWRVDESELVTPTVPQSTPTEVVEDVPLEFDLTEDVLFSPEQDVAEEVPAYPPYNPIPPPLESEYPNECPIQNPLPPCRGMIVDIIDEVLKFVREFPTTCLGRQIISYSS